MKGADTTDNRSENTLEPNVNGSGPRSISEIETSESANNWSES